MSYRILDAGDAALTIEFGSVIDPALLASVNALDAAILRLQQAGALPGVIETMPTFRSLTVFFDPLATDRDTLLAALQPLIDAAEHGTPVDGRHWRLPVCYEGEAAPDLAEVAATLGIGTDEVEHLPEQGLGFVHAQHEVYPNSLRLCGFARVNFMARKAAEPRKEGLFTPAPSAPFRLSP